MEGQAFSALLRRYRVAAGISQETLAERAGLSTQAVSAIERGERRAPRRETVTVLARALALNAQQFAALEATVRRTRRPRPAHAVPIGLPDVSPLIGREADTSVVAYLLHQPHVRLLTIVGPGGVGKTRLAVQAAIDLASSFNDGICWVDLSPVRDPDLVLPTIAERLALHQPWPEPLLTLLVAYLGQRQLLLALDNLEHLLPASAALQLLLDACPGLRILATSRVPPRVRGAQEYVLTPLPLPPPELQDPEAIGAYAAVALFLERAREVMPRLALTASTAPILADVCRRLDGLPLAIELAAALARLLPPQAMLDRLIAGTPARAGTLELLDGGAWDRPDRQQTMRDAIAWSHDLLTPAEQALFRRYSVFAGGSTLTAPEAVCAAPNEVPDVRDSLASLLDKSLLVRHEGGNAAPRIRMLQTIRDYAGERLETSGESQRTRERLAIYIQDLALEAEPELEGPRQVTWLERLDAELDNIRAVLQWSVEGADLAIGVRLAAALLNFWTIRGRFTEARNWVERLLERTEAGNGGPISQGRIRLLHTAGRLAYLQGDNPRALAMFEQSLAHGRTLNDGDGILSALNDIGAVAFRMGDAPRAEALYEEALTLRRERGEPRLVAQLLNNLATSAFAREDFARGIALSEQSLGVLRELDDRYSIAAVLTNIAQARLDMADILLAAAACAEGLPLARELRATEVIARFLAVGGSIARRRGMHEQAQRQLAEALALYRDLGANDELWRTLEELAFVALDAQQFERSVLLQAAASKCYDLAGTVRSAAEQSAFDRCLATATVAMGTMQFEVAWARGYALPLADALALGMGAGT